MTPEQREEWECALQFYRANPIDIRHQGMTNPKAVSAAAQQLKLKHGRLDLVIVDHMHIMRGDGKNDTERITSVSKSLLAISHELEVPVLALAQLNRQVEHREDPEPGLSDLRASGSIEEDGCTIFFLHRPKKDTPSLVRASIAKNRRGGSAGVDLEFKADLSSFGMAFPPEAQAWSP